jgi:hypothetical protein
LPDVDVDSANLVVMPVDPELDVAIQFDAEQKPLLVSGGIDYHDIFRELLDMSND